jgi:hypothetical protein
MQNRRLDALLLLAACLVAGGVAAQTVYKCGNTYSQLPCPDAAVIKPDPRSNAQKAQADRATARDARIANAMEKSRLQQEKADLAANTPPARPAIATSASKPRPGAMKKKKKETDALVVRSPGRKKSATDKSASPS